MNYIQQWFIYIHSFDASTLSNIILLLTLFVIIRYTYATFGLFKESQFQSELGISPFIILKFNNKTRHLIVKNIGKGLALNVQVTTFSIHFTERDLIWDLRFDPINYLETEEERILTYKAFEKGAEIRHAANFIYAALIPSEHKTKEYELQLFYNNSLGKPYFTRFVTGGNEIRIIEISKMTWFKKLFLNLNSQARQLHTRAHVMFAKKVGNTTIMDPVRQD